MHKIGLFVASFIFLSNLSFGQRITVTVAGNGVTGTGGEFSDGVPGIYSSIEHPQDVCVDANNNIYYTGTNRIMKLSASDGRVTKIGGTTTGGTIADGVPATDAYIAPKNICLDSVGNIYFSSGNKIRKIDAVTNIITTVAGASGTGFSGDGGPATDALFNTIKGICIDRHGNLFLADANNNRIRKIEAGTGIVTTVAGTGVRGDSGDGGPALAAELNFTEDIIVNPAGDLYIADKGASSLRYRIRKIDALTGVITTVAGTSSSAAALFGPALGAMLGEVTGICFDNNGNINFNEISCSCRKFDLTTDSIYAVAGDFAIESYADDTNSLFAWMHHCRGLDVDREGNLFIADDFNNRIRKVITLTHTPTFAYGENIAIGLCENLTFPINTQMFVTDLDSAQLEVYSVLEAPVHGSLTGFPYSTLSVGKSRPIKPVGMSYVPVSGFTGSDSFKVKVSDGLFADTVTVYVNVSGPPEAGVITSSSGDSLCFGIGHVFLESIAGGDWATTTGNTSIDSVGTVTAISPGVDTIVYTVTDFRCTNTVNYPVTVIADPVSGVVSGSDSVCLGSSFLLSSTVGGGIWEVSGSHAGVSPTGVVSAISAGIETISYSVTNFCGTSVSTKTVVVDSTPFVGDITCPDEVCVGSGISLYNSVAGGDWTSTNGKTTIYPGVVADVAVGAASGLDTIVYSISNACGVAHTSTEVNVLPIPHVGPIMGDTVVCVGATVTLTDSAGGGHWGVVGSNCSISTSGELMGLAAGIDTVLYSVYNVCGIATTYKVVNIENCPEVVASVSAQEDFTLFPNPASSSLNIQCDNNLEISSVEINDVSGRGVLRRSFSDNRKGALLELDISQLKQGVYFIRVNGQHVRRFVKM